MLLQIDSNAYQMSSHEPSDTASKIKELSQLIIHVTASTTEETRDQNRKKRSALVSQRKYYRKKLKIEGLVKQRDELLSEKSKAQQEQVYLEALVDRANKLIEEVEKVGEVKVNEEYETGKKSPLDDLPRRFTQQVKKPHKIPTGDSSCDSSLSSRSHSSSEESDKKIAARALRQERKGENISTHPRGPSKMAKRASIPPVKEVQKNEAPASVRTSNNSFPRNTLRDESLPSATALGVAPQDPYYLVASSTGSTAHLLSSTANAANAQLLRSPQQHLRQEALLRQAAAVQQNSVETQLLLNQLLERQRQRRFLLAQGAITPSAAPLPDPRSAPLPQDDRHRLLQLQAQRQQLASILRQEPLPLPNPPGGSMVNLPLPRRVEQTLHMSRLQSAQMLHQGLQQGMNRPQVSQQTDEAALLQQVLRNNGQTDGLDPNNIAHLQFFNGRFLR